MNDVTQVGRACEKFMVEQNDLSGKTLFVSPHKSIIGKGVAAQLKVSSSAVNAAFVTEMLSQVEQGGGRRMLFAALPFDSNAKAYIQVPEQVMVLASPAADFAFDLVLPVKVDSVVSIPSEECYKSMVGHALDAIDAKSLNKVVLSRSLQISAQINVSNLIKQLLSSHAQGYKFAFHHEDSEGAMATLVGASPELLLSKNGVSVTSNPLAGSIPRCVDPEEDRRRAQNLLRSTKDLYEHELVVRSVAAALAPFCTQLSVPSRPSLLSTPTMWHLSTVVEGTLHDASTSSLSLAQALHPTPAVCGYPAEAARTFIQQHEGFDRNLFTGLVGWEDEFGDGEWAVTIRCSQVTDDKVTVYAGAGVVSGSEPERELRETQAKMRTMLNAMGLNEILEYSEEAYV
ncbi:Isochorismate synthase DhbC [Ephemeroptericola cinctiostellae]|uniref:isochorismate synthase n=1 Tax=Ephemeroptericola cinctiostellae TaxID=2268024 RepID=A0A345DB59_9BURK|nr:isochorismate synthase [Ephemeroptericola cinctiostellae]AXF85597.1 Isochorismate synthase DhbC [Ephemeroptericola cinctiostellae]